VVQTSPSNAEDAGSIPGQVAKIPHAKTKTNQKQYYNNSVKTLNSAIITCYNAVCI